MTISNLIRAVATVAFLAPFGAHADTGPTTAPVLVNDPAPMMLAQTCTTMGHITHCDNGITATQMGGITHFSDGTTCTTMGGITHCN